MLLDFFERDSYESGYNPTAQIEILTEKWQFQVFSIYLRGIPRSVSDSFFINKAAMPHTNGNQIGIR